MPEHTPESPPEMETTRLEAFSDGVFAVAITLLVLDIHTPNAAALKDGTLTDALLRQWPVYLAYTLSFVTILIYWVNHHNVFRLIRRADHAFLLMNGLFLMLITIIPFSSSLLAAYIERPDQRAAEIVYSGTFLAAAIIFNRMWAHAVRGGRLLRKDAHAETVRSISKAFSFGPPLYLVAFALAFVSAKASLALCIALAVFFALPSAISRAFDRM